MKTTDSTTGWEAASAGDSDDASASDPDNPPQRPPAPPPCEVAVDLVPAAAAGADPAWLRDRLAEAIRRLRRPVRRVGVAIVDDARMRELNRRHKGRDETTDVLAFEHSAGGGPIEADIAVCADEAARRAADIGHAVELELLLYALHGVLHCAGFDDRTEDGFRAMHAEEDRILTAIGVGPVFAREERGVTTRGSREGDRDRGNAS